MAAVLMVLAVPLAKLRPRQGRFARVGLAVLAYFIYSNLVAAVRVWIEKDSSGRRSSACGGCTCCRSRWRRGCCGASERPGPLWRRRHAGA